MISVFGSDHIIAGFVVSMKTKGRLEGLWGLAQDRIEVSTDLVSDSIIELLKEEYMFPLRVYLSKPKDSLVQSGRFHLTSAGVRLHEMWFIPD